MLKKMVIGVATTATLLTGSITTAGATSVMKPIQAGDGFYTTSPVTAKLPKMNMFMPAGLCTIAAIPKKGIAISAAHCFTDLKQPVWDEDGQRIGTVIGKNDGHDIALIKLNDRLPQIVSTIKTTGLNVGDKISKKGTSSDITEGEVISGRKTITALGSRNLFMHIIQKPYRMVVHDSYETNMCARHGDSGAPVYYKGAIVGILSSSNSEVCTADTQTTVVDLGRALKAYNKSHES